MNGDDKNLAQAIEEFAELISLAKQDNKKHLDEVIENVLRESEITGFKGSSLTHSIKNASELFQDQIEYSEDQLKERKSSHRKQVFKKITKRYFFKLAMTVTSVIILWSLMYPFMNNIVQGLLSGKIARQPETPEEGNILFAVMMFWVVSTWILSDSIYKRFIDKSLFVRSHTIEKVFKIGLILYMTFLGYILPIFQTMYSLWALTSHKTLTTATLISMFFTTDGIGILIIPLWLMVTILNLKSIMDRT